MNATNAVTLGTRVRERREELRLTQRDLAELAEVSERSVREIEHDKATIRLDVMNKVLRAVGLELVVEVRDGR